MKLGDQRYLTILGTPLVVMEPVPVEKMPHTSDEELIAIIGKEL